MSDRDSRLGYRPCELCGTAVDALNEVVEVEHLSASSELAAYSLKKYQLVVFKNVGLHGQSVARSFVKHRYIAYSAHRHIQRSRDRSCGQRQNVDISRHLLELFLLRNAKALLLVNDEKSEILEFYILAYKSVSSDDNVSLTTLELSQRVRLLFWRAEARDHIHVDRKRSHSAGQRLKMLKCQDSCGNEYRYLLSAKHSLICGSHCHLGLTKANVSAEKSVHRHGAHHIFLNVLDSRKLSVGLVVFKRRLEVSL